MSLRPHLRKISVILLLAASLASGCAGPQKQTINVSLLSFEIKMSATTAKAGEITFVVKNDSGDQMHEFIIVKTDIPADQMPIITSTNRLDEDELDTLGEVADLEVGLEQTLTMTLEPGNYVMLCNLTSHYAEGMYTAFTVTP